MKIGNDKKFTTEFMDDKKMIISLLVLCVIVLAAFFISNKFQRGSNNINKQAKVQAQKSNQVSPDNSKAIKDDKTPVINEALKKKQKVEDSRPAGAPTFQAIPDTSRPRPRPVGL